jgi:hypothetical protein
VWHLQTGAMDSRLKSERAVLVELVDEVRRHWPAARPALSPIAAKLQDEALPADDRAAESALDSIARAFRRTLLAHVNVGTREHFRSPEHHAGPKLPCGKRQSYTYERNISAAELERAIRAGAASAEGWHDVHVSFSSGMAALLHILQSCVSMLAPAGTQSLQIAHWGGYFETDMVLQYLSSAAVQWRAESDVTAPLRADDVDILSIEPVRYDWELTSLDLDTFIRAWRAAIRRPRILLIDTTLCSFTWPTAAFLSALRDGHPLLVVQYRSGLKLDQQGLELANLGIVSAYSCDEGAGTPSAEQLAVTLRMARGATGAALSADAVAALDLPFLFDPAWLRRHAGRVFVNAAQVAERLHGINGIFSRVAHPSLPGRSQSLRHAPFIVCQLAEDSLEHHALLLGVLVEEARRRRVPLTLGSSFGFRGHRCETIIPRLSTDSGMFKIAPGARAGPELDDLVSVLSHIAAFRDIDQLRAAYPDVKPADLVSSEVLAPTGPDIKAGSAVGAGG